MDAEQNPEGHSSSSISEKLDTEEEDLKNERDALKALAYCAKEIVAGESLIRLNPRYKTIFSGLKLNHPRNVAIIHPLMFLVRRVVYILAILLYYKRDLTGILMFHSCTLVMLGYAILEL